MHQKSGDDKLGTPDWAKRSLMQERPFRRQDVYDRQMHSRVATKPVNSQVEKLLRPHIVEPRQSPKTVAALMKIQQTEYAVCAKESRNFIDRGLFVRRERRTDVHRVHSIRTTTFNII